MQSNGLYLTENKNQNKHKPPHRGKNMAAHEGYIGRELITMNLCKTENTRRMNKEGNQEGNKGEQVGQINQ